MRLFIALDIPAEIRARLTEYMERARALAPEARWARVEGLHVTLKFIGEASETRAQEIQTALSSLISSPPFIVSFESVGFFPSPESPRSFWIGIRDSQPLHDLAMMVDKIVAVFGITRESRPYKPHLTLARSKGSVKDLLRLRSLTKSESRPQFGTMIVRELLMFKSELGKEGAKYTKIASFQLKGPGS